MSEKTKTAPPKPGEETDLDRPRLTPQGRASEGGDDETDPTGGIKEGQGDKAEG